jgi:phage major head subunit gpT-like protein
MPPMATGRRASTSTLTSTNDAITANATALRFVTLHLSRALSRRLVYAIRDREPVAEVRRGTRGDKTRIVFEYGRNRRAADGVGCWSIRAQKGET